MKIYSMGIRNNIANRSNSNPSDYCSASLLTNDKAQSFNLCLLIILTFFIVTSFGKTSSRPIGTNTQQTLPHLSSPIFRLLGIPLTRTLLVKTYVRGAPICITKHGLIDHACAYPQIQADGLIAVFIFEMIILGPGSRDPMPKANQKH